MSEDRRTQSAPESEAELRQQREQEYHDRVYGSGEYHDRPTDGFYDSARASFRWYEGQLLSTPAGAKVLEYGCGDGSYAFELARRGAQVTGIDISPVAIEQAERRAQEDGVAESTEFQVMNCESLEFADRSFDLICGSGILHHVDLEKGYGELARTLKADGRAVFLEPLGHNPLIKRYRDRTPDLRTEDEHPLLLGDLEDAERFFEGVETHFFHLLSLAAAPLRKLKGFKGLVGALDAGDRFLFRHFPRSRKHAWIVAMVMTGPRQVTNHSPSS